MKPSEQDPQIGEDLSQSQSGDIDLEGSVERLYDTHETIDKMGRASHEEELYHKKEKEDALPQLLKGGSGASLDESGDEDDYESDKSDDSSQSSGHSWLSQSDEDEVPSMIRIGAQVEGEVTAGSEYGGNSVHQFSDMTIQVVKGRLKQETAAWRGAGVEIESVTSFPSGQTGWKEVEGNIAMIPLSEESEDGSISIETFQNDEELLTSGSEDESKSKAKRSKSPRGELRQMQLPVEYQKTQRPAKHKRQDQQNVGYLERRNKKGKQLSLSKLWGLKGGKETDKVGEWAGDILTPN